jgi:hypothetical protein
MRSEECGVRRRLGRGAGLLAIYGQFRGNRPSADIRLPQLAESSFADGVELNPLAALWPGVDHHRTIRGGRTPQPAAAVAADARAVAFARWINTRDSDDEDDADLTVAGEERFDNGVDEAHFRGPLFDRFESLLGASRLATHEQCSLL